MEAVAEPIEGVTDAGTADFENHHISGYATHGGHFAAPLFSQIRGNLWMGGCPRGKLPAFFENVVCLYPWEPYDVHQHQVRVNCWLYDDLGEVPEKRVVQLAAMALILSMSGPTLIHCQAGLNRSGLVTASVLMIDDMTADGGALNADEAIALLRKQRCAAVLCNPVFEKWLREVGPHGVKAPE